MLIYNGSLPSLLVHFPRDRCTAATVSHGFDPTTQRCKGVNAPPARQLHPSSNIHHCPIPNPYSSLLFMHQHPLPVEITQITVHGLVPEPPGGGGRHVDVDDLVRLSMVLLSVEHVGLFFSSSFSVRICPIIVSRARPSAWVRLLRILLQQSLPYSPLALPLLVISPHQFRQFSREVTWPWREWISSLDSAQRYV